MIVSVIHGDMRDVLGKMIAERKVVQAVVTDPPYHLINNSVGNRSPNPGQYTPIGKPKQPKGGFMGKQWDGGDIAFQPGTWRLCFDLLPPGGHLLAFSGTRTYHRMAVAIEEAGFEMRDTIAWLYGSGFPKSLNVSKAIDRAAGAEREVVGQRNDGRYAYEFSEAANRSGGIMGEASEQSTRGQITQPATDAARQWDGWGTALKPAMELICLARKPLVGTVAANVLKHGTGALNIDGCRVAHASEAERDAKMAWAAAYGGKKYDDNNAVLGTGLGINGKQSPDGRWPANVCHDGSDEVVKAFPAEAGSYTGQANASDGTTHRGGAFFGQKATPQQSVIDASRGSAARFFYSSKADADDRLGSKHPTIKPVDLMRWLVRLITPPGGTVLDPFAGSGATGMACMAEGIDCILIEREAEYVADIKARVAHVHGDDTPLFKVSP